MKNKPVTLSLFLALLLSGCNSGKEPNIPNNEPEEEIVFYDDFNTFDGSVWTKETHEEGWTNQELQYYSPSQVSVGKDGSKTVLILTACRSNGKIISGRINSKGKKSFKYGKIEASIKLAPTANGLWPAFWMMGDNTKEWPACGEIDIMEMGDATGIADGTSKSRVNTAIHYGTIASTHQQEYFAANTGINLQDGEYHLYTLVWNKEVIEISVDGKHFHSFDITDNPYFHDRFFILFNLAVGGSFTGITDPNSITAIQENEQVKMFIDWVKVSNLK